MKNFYAFKNEDSPDSAELSIYDEIGFWGTTAKDFYTTLKAIKASKIVVKINSPGGSVVDGYAIYNMLRAHAADIEVHVDGIAASIASVIAMAGDRIVMPENALMFIHQPLTNVYGNADEMRKVAEDLDKIAEGIITIYEARSGMSRKDIQAMMEEETLLTAKEAKAKGFADEILPELKVAAHYKAEDYFTGTVVDRVKAVHNAAIPPVNPTGGQETTNNNPNNMSKFKTQEEAENRVAALEGENTQLKTSVETAKSTAHQEATDKAKADEKSRKDGIKALAEKHNKNGDLNTMTVEALSGDITVEAFKDKVMEAIAARPSKEAIKPGSTEDKGDFATRYAACKTPAERRALVKANKAEAKAHLRTINS